jgi:hypothetical protein
MLPQLIALFIFHKWKNGKNVFVFYKYKHRNDYFNQLHILQHILGFAFSICD